MFLASFPAGPWQTNCYLVATEPGGDCLIVDPGFGAEDQIAEVIDGSRLTPVAVLATHGHLDHVFSFTAVCQRYRVPGWIHGADRHLLTDPLAGLGPGSADLVTHLVGPGGVEFTEPDDVRDLAAAGRPGGAGLDLAGLSIGVRHAPGHTAGSVLLTVPYPDDDRIGELLLAGDVLFAGAIGRTDLPGGDDALMRVSLTEQILPLADSIAVLPGHGGQTTIGRERLQNPYLQPSYLDRSAAPARPVETGTVERGRP